MAAWLLQWAGNIAAAFALWCVGAVFFDAVHWCLHQMLRSRWSLVRALAWPHAVHHQWLDRDLKIHWDLQTKNVFCHIVPEFLTQLAFSAFALLFLPAPIVAVCVAMQVLVFLGLLSYRGLDINHRPIELLDAYQPSWMALPAYHALHHVFPDAYFSAYGKLVDWATKGGAMLAGRRFAVVGPDSPLRASLCEALRQAGVALVDDPKDAEAPDGVVLLDPATSEKQIVEAFVARTSPRLLAPEVWSVHVGAPSGLARHYYRDVRVLYRAISVSAGDLAEPGSAARAAQQIVSRAQRGFHFIRVGGLWAAWSGFRHFRRTRPESPGPGGRVRSRVAVSSL